MLVTTFNSKSTLNKIPQSPFGNNEFIFETINVDNIIDIFDIMVSNFVMNTPLNIKKIKAPRKKESLKDYINDKIDYVIIDIDHIEKPSDTQLWVRFFKDNNYKCILGESRAPNNIKGVIEVEKTDRKNTNTILKNIEIAVKAKYPDISGNVDTSSTNPVSFQAPILKRRIHFVNLDGIKYPTSQLTQSDQSTQLTQLTQSHFFENDEISQLFKSEFEKRGFVFCEYLPEYNSYRVSHPSEKKSPKGFSWNPKYPRYMRHWNPERSVELTPKDINTEQYKKILKNIRIKEFKEILNKKHKKNIKTNERYLSNHPDVVTDFLNNFKLLKIQSPMGTGKSNIINEVIKQSEERDLRILFITNRRTLADDINNKYSNIKHYEGTSVEGNEYIEGDNLVVQIESLHKYDIRLFDVVILDEYSTLLEQLIHIYTDKKPFYQKVIKKFFKAIQTRKHIVVADAFIFDDTLNFVKPEQIIGIENEYRDDSVIQLYKQKDNFLKDLVLTAIKEPITFSSGSLQVMNVVSLFLKNLGVSHYIIDASTSKQEKEKLYKQFKQKKLPYQVLMFSPTITVGISIENDTSTHFHYDPGSSIGVLPSLQMVKRNRNAKNFKIYLQKNYKYYPTNIEKIIDTLDDFHIEDDYGDYVSVSDVGRMFAKIIQIRNILENIHKYSFVSLMKYQFKTNGNVSTNNNEVKPFYHKMSKIVKKQLQKKKLDLFEEYRKLTPDQISELDMKLFGTNFKEQIHKEFIKYNDELSVYLDKKSIDLLIKEDVIYPGLIDAFFKIKKQKLKLKKIYSKKEKEKLDFDMKEYGYKKHKNRYIMNSTLWKLVCD